MTTPIEIHVGYQFGQWTVISLDGGRAKDGHRQVVCQCACGYVRHMLHSDVRRKKSLSCYTCSIAPEVPIVVGQEFDKWKVIALDGGKDKGGRRLVVCQCVCGRTQNIAETLLRCRRIRSCRACHPYSPRHISVGDIFDRWTVIAVTRRHNKEGKQLATCQCACGTIAEVLVRDLYRHTSKGCVQCGWASQVRHGHTLAGQKSLTYETWIGMRQRCENSQHTAWGRYGGRGLRVCERWQIFENFLADMGERPTKGHTIERKRNELGYEPENCVWSTRLEQARNRSTNRLVTFQGQTHPLVVWGEITGMPARRIRGRLDNGWSVEDALTLPYGTRKR